MCCRILKRLWEALNSPITAFTVQQEHRELKHKIRNAETKIDGVLNRLVRDMREDAERLSRSVEKDD
jgi:replicative DNA helicase